MASPRPPRSPRSSRAAPTGRGAARVPAERDDNGEEGNGEADPTLATMGQRDTPPPSFTSYLREIAKYPVLTASEERAVATRAAAGDPDAIQKLVNHNLRFVVHCARTYERLAPIEDLVQEGSIGLMTAARKFDPTRGTRFVSYASYWINQSMRSHLAAARTVRIPVNRNTQLLQIRRATRLLEEAARRQPSVREIALATQLPESTVAILQSVDRQDISMQDQGQGEDASPLEDRLPHQGPGADGRTLLHDRDAAVEALLSSLRPRDARVLRLWFGIGTGRPSTLDEIGIMLGVTRERVRQLRDRALDDLRAKATPAQQALLQESFFQD